MQGCSSFYLFSLMVGHVIKMNTLHSYEPKAYEKTVCECKINAKVKDNV